MPKPMTRRQFVARIFDTPCEKCPIQFYCRSGPLYNQYRIQMCTNTAAAFYRQYKEVFESGKYQDIFRIQVEE